jgi:hypothetical protein
MKTCEIEGCERPNLARQMCSMHYARWKRTGSATEMKRIVGGTVVDRLRHRTTYEGDCWVFNGPIIHRDRGDGNNYRGIRLANGGAYVSAHVASYSTLVRAIPDGHEVHHLCGTKACWRPAHLIAMTDEEHNRLHHLRKDGQCKRGHDMTKENSLLLTNGRIACKACAREATNRWKAEHRDQVRKSARESYHRSAARKKEERERKERAQQDDA